MSLVKKAGLKVGQTVPFEEGDDGSITIRPVLECPNLDILLSQVTLENHPDEADIAWGKPQGSEVW